MRYIYKSPVGTFWIQPQDGRWMLGIDDERLGSYAEPRMAADDVATHASGWSDWDIRLADVNEPGDLSEWEKIQLRQ